MAVEIPCTIAVPISSQAVAVLTATTAPTTVAMEERHLQRPEAWRHAVERTTGRAAQSEYQRDQGIQQGRGTDCAGRTLLCGHRLSGAPGSWM